MKKILFYLSPVVLALGVFLTIVGFFYSKNPGKGALQITSIPKSKVYLDGKYMGETPFCRCDQNNLLPVKSYDLKLVPEGSNLEQFEYRININPSVLTVVDRTFGGVGKSSGSIITLDKLSNNSPAQLFVSTFPYGANVSLDGNNIGNAPLTKSVTASDHDLNISFSGYKNKDVKVHTVDGYKLDSIIFLSTADLGASSISSPTPTIAVQTVKILDTPTGFLRVRDNPSLGGNEIAQVKPGETYPLITEQNGWYEIKLSSTSAKLGWITASYAVKQ